ncbi:gp53-like domain-containing protein [Romboutsia sp.]|uniref:gp53-like domain-containing protein n=1 Tax=Romboutsia sp. TaxID=1965302 RepID=UPI002CF436A7|nr:hypothetical protein [Romboutsia sp.]HSQ90159.1 hypothetical protein [Romboutsia sp.]
MSTLTTEEKALVHAKALQEYNIGFVAKHIDPINTDLSKVFGDVEGAKNGIDDNLKVSLDEQYARKDSINVMSESFYIGDDTSPDYKAYHVNRNSGGFQCQAKFGVSNPNIPGVGILYTKDGVEQNAVYLNENAMFVKNGSTTDVGTTTNSFKDIWLGSRSISSTGYCKLPNGMIMQWGNRTLPNGGTPNTTEEISFPIAFPTQCVHVSADNGRSSNSWYDLCMTAVAVSNSAVRLHCKTISNTNILGTLTCTWFAIGY